MRAYERLLNYVRVHTTSDENSGTHPSAEREFDLARQLVEEMKALGMEDAHVDEHCYVYGTLPATPGCEDQHALGLIAHMDTADDASGENVQPVVWENYNGGDVTLPATGMVMKPSVFPFLTSMKGETLITSDGTTLLGADDKAGIAEILTAVETIQEKGLPHGKLCIAFTPDEEIGEGAELFDIPGFGADFAYTVDGGDITDYEYETFNAAKATVTIHGFSIHPGTAKDKMKNAILMAGEYNALLPALEIPGHTEGYEGFFHLQEMHGTVEKADMIYIVRDHSMERFQERKAMMEKAAAEIDRRYGAHTAEVELQDQYYNMHEVLKDHMEILKLAEQAMKAAGIAAPTHSPIRGGTDGSVLTYMGLPCPNLPSAGHNAHGRFEYAPVESLKTGVRIIRELLSPALVESVILKKKG